MSTVVLDTGVWYALCDARDTSVPRKRVEDIYRRLEFHRVVLPWPVAYETLRTRFTKNKLALERFEREARNPKTIFFDDSPYRKSAYELVFESGLRSSRPLSMVDCLIRLLIEDVQVKVDFVVTFNARDFADACRKRQIELWEN